MEVISEKDLAVLLDLSPWTVRGWRIKSGLPFFRIGNKIYYRLEAVENWIAREEMNNAVEGSVKHDELVP